MKDSLYFGRCLKCRDFYYTFLPVLVIAGTKDMIKKEHTELIAKSIPGSRLSFIEGSHFVAAEDPEKYNRAVEEFLEAEDEHR